MIPCYTCLEQSTTAGPARQSRTLDLPRTAHHLYSITTATYNHPRAIMQSKQGYRLEQYTNSKRIKMKSLENESTSRYEHVDAKITKNRI